MISPSIKSLATKTLSRKNSYASFKEKDLLQFFDKFTSKSVVNLRDVIHNHPEENLFFSLKTINNERIRYLRKSPKIYKDGHTDITLIHSMQILSSIRKLDFSDWKEYSLKLNYNFCFLAFYSSGFLYLPFALMSTKLTDDNKLIRTLSRELNNETIPFVGRKKIFLSNINEFQRNNILNEPKYLF